MDDGKDTEGGRPGDEWMSDKTGTLTRPTRFMHLRFLPFYVLRVDLIKLPSSIYGQCCICHCRLPGSYCMASLIPNDCTVTLFGTSAAIKDNPPSTDFRLFFLPYLLKLCMCMTHLLEFSELDWLGTGYLVYTRGSIR